MLAPPAEEFNGGSWQSTEDLARDALQPGLDRCLVPPMPVDDADPPVPECRNDQRDTDAVMRDALAKERVLTVLCLRQGWSSDGVVVRGNIENRNGAELIAPGGATPTVVQAPGPVRSNSGSV